MKEMQDISMIDQAQMRRLGKDNYFVDADGNAFEPYSMAWRYLGLFIDCNNNNNKNHRSRNLNENDQSSCKRRLLWAAYHDENYKGGSIGEYNMFDRQRDRWDNVSCRGQTFWPFTRCQRMDCHERGTSWKLIGVYKETDGLDDWSEQLFKHHGYCLWGAADREQVDNGQKDDASTSDYEFMQNYRETWTTECRQLQTFAAADGSTLYMGVKPMRRGEMTMAIYSDSSCIVESKLLYSDYLEATAGDNNNHDDESSWQSSVDRWNDLLGDYTICQPCRAYSLTRSKGNNGNGGSENEGEGEAEKWGFNCFDAAGYRNCNQCYKFATKTDMEEASIADLVEASKQGTILAILVEGKTYGSGQPHGFKHGLHRFHKTSIIVLAVFLVVGSVLCYKKMLQIRRRRRRAMNAALGEDLTVKTTPPPEPSSSSSSSRSTSSDDSSDEERNRPGRRSRRGRTIAP